jgi:hypothetical protein
MTADVVQTTEYCPATNIRVEYLLLKNQNHVKLRGLLRL